MIIDSIYPTVATDDFARRFSQRGGNLVWLLGAGASAAAGIPTAWDMIWEFKQQLYVSQRRVSPKQVADLANPAVRRELQSFIDGIGSLPAPGSPDEYAALFESVYPSEADRRTYIASKISGAKPSYGHVALATLMKGARCRLVWTTNFDPLVADGCAKVYGGTGQLTTVAIETGSLLLVWTRLIMPNGRSIVLERQQGADVGGYSGLEDEVDNHGGELAKAALLSTVLSVGSEVGSGADTGNNTAVLQALRLGAANSLNQTGQRVVRRNLNIQPTLTIRPGFPVRVIVNRDLALEPYRGRNGEA